MIDHPSNRCDGGHVPTEGRPELCHMHMERKAQEAEAAEQLAREKYPEAFNDQTLAGAAMTRDEAKADAEQALRSPSEPVTEPLPDDLGARVYPDDSGTLTLPLEPVGGASGTWEEQGSGPHGSHYGGASNPYEAIKIIEALDLGFHLGTALKYLCRAGRKSSEDGVKDLEKLVWYVQRDIERRKLL